MCVEDDIVSHRDVVKSLKWVCIDTENLIDLYKRDMLSYIKKKKLQ